MSGYGDSGDNVQQGLVALATKQTLSRSQNISLSLDDAPSIHVETEPPCEESSFPQAPSVEESGSSSVSRISPASITARGSSSESDNDARPKVWSCLASHDGIWGEGLGGEDDPNTNGVFRVACDRVKQSAISSAKMLAKNPSIVIATFFVFAVFCSVGTIITIIFSRQHEDLARASCIETAEEVGQWFSNQLDQAILPLFSLAQFVHELPIFHDLASHIGMAGKNGSLPLLPPNVEGAPSTHRNITGLCDDSALVERFNRIARTIKENARMEGVLVNLQLAPEAVVCLLHPLNNTEDFPEGVFMDNTGALGHDLLNDPERSFIAKETLQSDKLVIAGPLSLKQCGDCDPTVEHGLIARLPIAIDGFQIKTKGGQIYKKWGFAVAIINWQALVDRSDIQATIANRGQKFRLTRTDRIHNPTTNQYDEKVVILAETPGYDLRPEDAPSVDLETTNNLWKMSVGLESGFEAPWMNWAIVGVVSLSLVVSTLVMVLLMEQHARGSLLKQMLPPTALRMIKRGRTVVEKFNVATIFFADIVGYTNLAAEMRPVEVMSMLNEFFSGLDAIAEYHGVYKVETAGDAYLVAGGVPDRCSPEEGARKVALFALAAIEFTRQFRTHDGLQFSIRAGLNSGPVVAGVVGASRPKYTLFGDTMNTASRMESSSQKMRIQCSNSTYTLLAHGRNQKFELEERGVVEVKGKGPMRTWWLNKSLPYQASQKRSGDTIFSKAGLVDTTTEEESLHEV